MKKSIIFGLLVLIAQPAYPVWGASTAGRLGSTVLSGLYNGVKEHPWITAVTIGAVLVGVYRVLEINNEQSEASNEPNNDEQCQTSVGTAKRHRKENIKKILSLIKEFKENFPSKKESIEITKIKDWLYNIRQQPVNKNTVKTFGQDPYDVAFKRKESLLKKMIRREEKVKE